MSTNTLTSLAILKVNVDQGKDYLDYLRPFILQVLVEKNPDPIIGGEISQYLRERFGLVIPERIVEIVLKRLSRHRSIKRESGVYRKIGDIPDPRIAPKQAAAERHIDAVLSGLRQFSQSTIKPISSNEAAIVAICGFLAEFGITCLRAYLRGTAIPSLGESPQTDIVLVSNYVQQLRQTDPERFDSFLVLVQGHMLANALMCPDLGDAPNTYNEVTFYLDTPLLVQRLGAEGKARQDATRELIGLLRNLGGKVAAFSHSREELQRVLQGAAEYLEAADGRGAIVFEARKRGTTRSDLLLLAESVDDKLLDAGIEVLATPPYIKDSQIDESVFQNILDDGVLYQNPRAKEYDINSVRSIYVIRANTPAPSVEKACAVFVTSNTAFARVAWEYGQQHEAFQDVSSVITDFSLANMAWLKAPMGAPEIPTTQLLASSYAALEPPRQLLDKYMIEIDRLERLGTITARDHQLLRSSPLVYPELMRLTLGEDAFLTAETVAQTLERVSNEIKKEESERLMEEREAHRRTCDVLNIERTRNQEVIKNIYWPMPSESKWLSMGFFGSHGACACNWLFCWIGTPFVSSGLCLGAHWGLCSRGPAFTGESSLWFQFEAPPQVGAKPVFDLASQT